MPSGIASCGTTEGQYTHLRLVTMGGGGGGRSRQDGPHRLRPSSPSDTRSGSRGHVRLRKDRPTPNYHRSLSRHRSGHWARCPRLRIRPNRADRPTPRVATTVCCLELPFAAYSHPPTVSCCKAGGGGFQHKGCHTGVRCTPFDKSLESFNPCLTTRRRLMDWDWVQCTGLQTRMRQSAVRRRLLMPGRSLAVRRGHVTDGGWQATDGCWWATAGGWQAGLSFRNEIFLFFYFH